MEMFVLGIILTMVYVILGMGVLSFMDKANNWDTDNGRPFIVLVWPIILIIEAFA